MQFNSAKYVLYLAKIQIIEMMVLSLFDIAFINTEKFLLILHSKN